jgi:hypothetical protein
MGALQAGSSRSYASCVSAWPWWPQAVRQPFAMLPKGTGGVSDGLFRCTPIASRSGRCSFSYETRLLNIRHCRLRYMTLPGYTRDYVRQ